MLKKLFFFPSCKLGWLGFQFKRNRVSMQTLNWHFSVSSELGVEFITRCRWLEASLCFFAVVMVFR